MEQGSEAYELDLGDPNFDDEDEWVDGLPADFVPRRKRNNSSIRFEVSSPRIAPHDLEELTKEQIRQYLLNEDLDDFVASINKMKIDGEAMGEILYYAVNLSMDYNARERELVSVLISGLNPKHLSDEAIRKGFNQLVMGVDDLVMDTPNAVDYLAKFLGRAVADDCLAPCFLTQRDGLSPRGVKVVEKAGKLLNGPHGMARMDNVWGRVGGSVDLEVLQDKIIMFIREYISSGDAGEATRCLVELGVTHYHHEAVYQIIYHALQNPTSGDSLFKLLKKLFTANICSQEAVTMGVERIYQNISDIALDIPYCHQNLDYWITDVHNEGIISDQLLARKPKIGRKRYASSSLPHPNAD